MRISFLVGTTIVQMTAKFWDSSHLFCVSLFVVDSCCQRQGLIRFSVKCSYIVVGSLIRAYLYLLFVYCLVSLPIDGHRSYLVTF